MKRLAIAATIALVLSTGAVLAQGADVQSPENGTSRNCRVIPKPGVNHLTGDFDVACDSDDVRWHLLVALKPSFGTTDTSSLTPTGLSYGSVGDCAEVARMVNSGTNNNINDREVLWTCLPDRIR